MNILQYETIYKYTYTCLHCGTSWKGNKPCRCMCGCFNVKEVKNE